MTWLDAFYAWWWYWLAVVGVACLAQVAARRIARWRAHHRVPRYKLRRLRATTEAWIEGLRCDHTPAQSSTPAPGRASGAPGVGLEPRPVVNAPSTAHLPDDGPGRRILYVFHSFPAPKQPVDGRDPTPAVDRPPLSVSASTPDLALTGSTDSGADVIPRAPAPGQAA